jgi:arylsulfatase
MDPFERASTDANAYFDWADRKGQFLVMGGIPIAAKMISTFKDYPPRQKPASFNLDAVMQSFMEPAGN